MLGLPFSKVKFKSHIRTEQDKIFVMTLTWKKFVKIRFESFVKKTNIKNRYCCQLVLKEYIYFFTKLGHLPGIVSQRNCINIYREKAY